MPWLPTSGLVWPERPRLIPGNSIPVAVNATGNKLAVVGRVWWDGDKTNPKSISRVHFRIDGLTKAGGSNWTISLQDVDLSAGPPYRPDGVADQTVAAPNASVANGWYRSDALSAVRVVAHNALVACVVEFSGARLGADSLAIGLTQIPTEQQPALGGMVLWDGASWVLKPGCPSFMLEFSDGTYGNIDNCLPISGNYSANYNSDTVTEQKAALFTAPFTAKVEGWAASLFPRVGTADFEVRLLDANDTVLASSAYDANAVDTVVTKKHAAGLFPSEAVIHVGRQYRLLFLPTTPNDITLQGDHVADVAYYTAWPGGRQMQYSERDGAGSWVGNDTRRVYASLRISAILDPAPRADLHPIEMGVAG